MKELFGLVQNLCIEAVFPEKCSCGKWGNNICGACGTNLLINKTDLCPGCGKISPFGLTCSNCKNKSNLTSVMILGKHMGVLKDSIWRLKYGHIKNISGDLATLLADKFGEKIKSKSPILSWVPESKSKLRIRGYNQSREIAYNVSKILGLDCVELLNKVYETKSQVGLHRSERLRNVLGSIGYIGPKEPTNKRVFIVDDVYTTGATLEECAKVLRANGYREVWGIVLSRD